MVKVFISYAQQDEATANRLKRALEVHGVTIQSVHNFAEPGTGWISALEDVIKSADLFFVLLSKNTEKSHGVNSEIALALSEAEEDGRPRIVPVLVDKDTQIPFFLRHIQAIKLSTPEVLTTAGAALFVDVLGLLAAVWKIVLNPNFYTRLGPVTRVDLPDLATNEVDEHAV